MMLEMRIPQLTAYYADLGGGRLQPLRRDGPFSELTIQVPFRSQKPLPNRDRLGLHGLEERLDARALLLGKSQLLCELKNVPGAGIAVQLGRESKPHASTCLQVGDLLVRQSFDLTGLQARIGLL